MVVFERDHRRLVARTRAETDSDRAPVAFSAIRRSASSATLQKASGGGGGPFPLCRGMLYRTHTLVRIADAAAASPARRTKTPGLRMLLCPFPEVPSALGHQLLKNKRNREGRKREAEWARQGNTNLVSGSARAPRAAALTCKKKKSTEAAFGVY